MNIVKGTADPDVDCFHQIKKRIIAQRPLNLFKITQSLLTIIVSNIAHPIVTNTGNANFSNWTISTRPKNKVYGVWVQFSDFEDCAWFDLTGLVS